MDADATPMTHHVGQLTAYQFAIAKTFEINPPPGLVVYVGRKDLQLREFVQPYDPGVLGDVINWMGEMTECRVEDVLPPKDPHQGDWDECYTCAFRERCGRGNEPWEDVREIGFIPLVEYPRDQAEDYLRANPGAKVTPTLAVQHPELQEQYSVYDWVCEACDLTFPFDQFDWSGGREDRPNCPVCVDERGACALLRGPAPEEQPS